MWPLIRPVGHLLPPKEAGEGDPNSLLPFLVTGEGARRVDEGPHANALPRGRGNLFVTVWLMAW
jgi:hypothetical protein